MMAVLDDLGGLEIQGDSCAEARVRATMLDKLCEGDWLFGRDPPRVVSFSDVS